VFVAEQVSNHASLPGQGLIHICYLQIY